MKPICEINEYGDKFWYLNGNLHREDGPAIEHIHGRKEWYLNGKRHRVDGPAIEYVNGAKAWLVNGNLHREDGLVIEYADGIKFWYYQSKEIDCKDNEEFLRMIKLMAFL